MEAVDALVRSGAFTAVLVALTVTEPIVLLSEFFVCRGLGRTGLVAAQGGVRVHGGAI